MNLENNNFSKKIEISTQTNIFCSGAFVVDGGRAVLPYPVNIRRPKPPSIF